MSDIVRSPINGNAILLTPRSGSHSLARAAVAAWYPSIEVPENAHPASVLPTEIFVDQKGLGIIVRNPIERFRSACAHMPSRALEEHLSGPLYRPLPQGEFARHFRFEDQFDAAAEWLGLPTPLPLEDATNEADKPILTPEQEARVREIYAADISLWESLQ